MRKRVAKLLAKYGAIQYFVRPFQKDALKKSVIAHFQDFLSSLPGVPIVESTPVPNPLPVTQKSNSVVAAAQPCCSRC